MSYYSYDEIVSAAHLLVDEYPGKAELLRLPNLSVESRPIYAIAIGETRGADAKTAVIVGGIHAREWIPPDALLSLCADILEASALGTGLSYGGSHFEKEVVSRIVSGMQLVIVPCANPDGRVYSQEVDPDWRKNRAPNPNSSGSICYGVDINRNFDVAWDFRRCFAPDSVSASDDPCHKYVYVGPAAASEPETRNIVWLLDHFAKAGWFIDVHSAIPAVFHGWGLDENQTVDEAQNFLNATFDGKRGTANDEVYGEFIDASDLQEVQRLSRLMGDTIRSVNGDDYEIGAAFSLYATSGASDDFAYSRHRSNSAHAKVLSFTMECGHDFQPDPPVRDDVVREVSAALLAFAADATAPPGF